MISIENGSRVNAAGYTARAEGVDYDVYVLSRGDGTPYLVLVGRADVHHGWTRWHGYEVFGLLNPDDQSENYVRPTPETPHEAIVIAGMRAFLSGDGRAEALAPQKDAHGPERG